MDKIHLRPGMTPSLLTPGWLMDKMSSSAWEGHRVKKLASCLIFEDTDQLYLSCHWQKCLSPRSSSFGNLSEDIPRSWAKKLGQAELYVDSDGEKPEDPNNAVAAGRALAVASVAAGGGAGP